MATQYQYDEQQEHHKLLHAFFSLIFETKTTRLFYSHHIIITYIHIGGNEIIIKSLSFK